MFITPIGISTYLRNNSNPASTENKKQTSYTVQKESNDVISFGAVFRKKVQNETTEHDLRRAREAKERAIRERFGTVEVSKVSPDVMSEGKKHLKEMGVENIKDYNFHFILEDAPYDKTKDKCLIISYYDDAKQASYRFTNDGDIGFLVKYRYSPDGEILSCYFDERFDFDTGKWAKIKGSIFY